MAEEELPEGFIFESNEELDEIDYYEIVSLDEIIKLNPSFVAFSNEEIYNHLFNFLKSKSKAIGFLNLFNSIIEKQQTSYNINNFIIIADANRDNFSELDINDFVNKIKNSNKEQINIAYKQKNKIWFPLIYDNESSYPKFNATSTTIIQLNSDNPNDLYIIFKDDERNIPIMGVYFYEPRDISNNHPLSEQIVSHLTSKNRFKDNIKYIKDFKGTFGEFINNYKIKLPLDKLDPDEYHYTNLNILLNKFNYDLDSIDLNNFTLLKDELEKFAKNEKIIPISHNHQKIKPLEFKNNRILFFDILKKTKRLLEITHKSSNEIKKTLESYKQSKTHITELPLIKDISKLLLNIDEQNYNEIINNLKEIRKNLSLDNSIYALTNFSNIDIDDIENFKNFFDKIGDKFIIILSQPYKDIYEINFTFENDEHEIIAGLNTKDYEGIPVKIDEYKKNAIYVDDLDEEEIINLINPQIDDKEIKKHLNNYYYKLEKGFIEALHFILPFIIKIQELSKLPLNLDIIIPHLFNIYRGIPEKAMIIKEKFNDKFDDNFYNQEAQKSIKFVLMNDNEDVRLKNAILAHIDILTNMIYDVICKWSIEIQREILEDTLIFNKDICYIPCIDKWNDFGAPYNIDNKEKDGVLYYLICIFAEVYKEVFSENDYNYLPLDSNYKNLIIDKIKSNYESDLKTFIKMGDEKKKKINKGYEAQKKLVELLQKKDYKNDKTFENFIEALTYMPSVKYTKIHKYLLGCCLEKIDENFTADTYLKINRTDLKKAKSIYANERVINKKRYKRFYISKTQIIEKKDLKKTFKGFDKKENVLHEIYDNSIDDWLNEVSDNSIITDNLRKDIKMKLRDTYNIHINYYIQNLFNKKNDLFKGFSFYNYKQILLAISKILFNHLKNDAIQFINQINQTIIELDKLSSIINDDNMMDIIQIRSIFVIRCMCLPAYPDINTNTKLIPKIKIDTQLHKSIINDIGIKVMKIIQDGKMPTLEDQINYINKIREQNKDKILATLNKKTAEEKDIFKEMKKIGLPSFVDEDDDFDVKVNPEKKDDNEVEGEDEYNINEEDNDIEYDDEKADYGFIYAD
jgi:hypothetical protein